MELHPCSCSPRNSATSFRIVLCGSWPLCLTRSLSLQTWMPRLRTRPCAPIGETEDKKWWMLSGNGIFSMKSFYNFLNDEGVQYPMARFFWRNSCLKKVNFFNWLVWKNKMLSIENFKKRRCNIDF